MHQKFKCVLAAALLISGTATAQHNPFPQQKRYRNCIKPIVEQSYMNAQVAEAYADLKSRFFKKVEQSGSTQYYVETHNNYYYDQVLTTSIIHAMAMNIVVQMAGYDKDAQKLFDGLVTFYENHITEYQGPNLMQMYVYKHDVYPTDGPQTLEYKNYYSNSAADIEIAMAFYSAYKQWGDITYKNKAQIIIRDIKKFDINPETQAIRLGSESYNMDSESYLYTSPASWNSNALKTFADITGDANWDRVSDQNYAIYTTFKNSKANWYGLIPDYLYFDGVETQLPPAGFLISKGVTNPKHYGEEAILFPLHAAFDYACDNDANAKAVLEDTERFIENSIGTITYNSVKKGYTLEGEPISDTAGSLRYIAPLSASLIAGTNEEALTNAWNAMVTTMPRDEIELALKVKAMLLISGNWFNFESSWPDEYDTLKLTIDDFADDKPVQSKIGAEYSAFHNFDAGSNWHITIPTDSGRVLCTNGTEVDADSPTALFHSDSKTMEATIQGSAEIALNFPNNAEYNLFDMDAALLRLKGVGKLQITFTANDDIHGDPGDFRGGYIWDFDLQEEWKEKRIDANLLAPEDYSLEHFNALMWNDVASRATGIRFSSADSSEVTLSLDWIKLMGKTMDTQTFEYKTGTVSLSNNELAVTANRLLSVVASSGVVRADLGVIQDETVDISIISLNGKTLYRHSHQLNRGANAVHMNVNSLAKGIYFMNVTGASINQVQKFIIQ